MVQQHVEALQQGAVGEALLVLPLDFSEVCQKLRKGQLHSLANAVEGVVEACHEAGVEHGFGNAHMKDSILEQADVLSTELAEALKVRPYLSCNAVLLSALIAAFKSLQKTLNKMTCEGGGGGGGGGVGWLDWVIDHAGQTFRADPICICRRIDGTSLDVIWSFWENNNG